jgi:hypothetical protein
MIGVRGILLLITATHVRAYLTMARRVQAGLRVAILVAILGSIHSSIIVSIRTTLLLGKRSCNSEGARP